MLPPHNKTIAELAKVEGIAEGTLYNWRQAARMARSLLPNRNNTPAG